MAVWVQHSERHGTPTTWGDGGIYMEERLAGLLIFEFSMTPMIPAFRLDYVK